MSTAPTDGYDVEFFWDPVCPFAWITSRWVEKVVAQKDYSVDWRFISLRLLNRHRDYATDFPPDYEHGHTAGLRMLRVAAATRAEYGRELMGPLYTALSSSIFDVPPGAPNTWGRDQMGTPAHIEHALGQVGLSTALAGAADDAGYDMEIGAETETALARTGHDVGTPIISFRPPDGPAFFGPVISRVPDDDRAVDLWDSIIHLASFPGFSELKRSLREVPQLRAFGMETDQVGAEEDWQGGSRRQ